MTQTYREPAVNMYDERRPIASRGDCDLMSLERSKSGWIAEMRIGPVTHRYVSEGGSFWFNMDNGDRVATSSAVDVLLCDRVAYLRAMKAAGQ